MSESVKMPALGESVTEGTVTRWLKNVGDSVEVDEPLLEVSTDKVDTEIPSPVAGVLEKVLVEEDETVEVGAELAVIGDGSGGGGDDSAPQQEEAPEAPAAPAETPAAEAAPAAQPAAENVEAAQPAAEQSTSPSEAREEASTAKPSSSGGGGGGGGGETVTMPALGESVTEGTVTRWLKAEGDTVEVDEPLLEVSTDKVDTEIPSPVAGVLTKILVQEDETVEVGAELAIVGGEAEEAAPEPEPEPEPEPKQEAKPEPKQEPEPEPEAKPEPKQEAAPSRTESPRPQEPGSTTEPAAGEHATAGGGYVTPLVRKIAAEKGVDLASVTGTGIGGRIRKQDVLDAAEKAAQPAAAPAAAAAPSGAPSAPSTIPEVSPLRGTTEKMSRLRKVIAKRMSESLTTSAQLTTVQEVDVTRIVKLRARTKDEFQRKHGVKLTYLPFFIKAVTDALKGHPKLNATIDGDQIVYHGQENIGIAVDTERGLLVPVIKNAGELDVAGIAKAIADLADRTRNNKIKPDELSGSTFTVTNIGSAGALFDTPIINQPEVAILGTGSIVKRPVVVADAEGGESIAVRSMVYLPVTYDHRIVDGADAGRFLTAVRKRLEEGAFDDELGL